MRHRHLNHQRFTLAAIDDVISRGRWREWAELRRAVLSDRTLLDKVERVCRPYASDPYAQRHHFWMHYAEEHRTATAPVQDNSGELAPSPALAISSVPTHDDNNEEVCMHNETEAAIRAMRVFPADDVLDQPGVAYGDVEYKGRVYSIQYSRPRHPWTIGETLDSGAYVYGDEGHDDNKAFAEALGDDVEFDDIVEHMVRVSGAERAIDRSESEQPATSQSEQPALPGW